MKKINFFFALLLTFMTTQLWAESTTDYFTGYTVSSDKTSLDDVWFIYPGTESANYAQFGSGKDYNYVSSAYGNDENYVTGYSGNYNKNVWLVLNKQVSGTVTFRSSNSASGAQTIYVTKFTKSGNTWSPVAGAAQSYSIASRASGKSNTFDAGTDATYIAFCIDASSSSYASKLRLLDVTYTEVAVTEPIMQLDITDVKFGKVKADASKTITVSNKGVGTLTATISSDNDMFEVSKSSVSVEAGESETFDITFKYDAEAYGGHSANITLTPNAGDAQVVKASAAIEDPTVWKEDFSGNADGWEVGTNWSVADGVAKAAYAYSSTGYLITPKLQVAAGEALEFDYKATANYVSVTIEMSKDDGAWTQYSKLSANTMSAFETSTIEGLESGVYRFRFKNDDYELDNFSGFHLATLEHDMAITDSNIPTSGDTNDEYTATVTVQEKAGKDETVTAKLYIDGAVVAEQEQTVAANETATIQISFTPTEAVSYKKAYIEVSYGDNSTVKTDETTISINTMLVIDEATANTFETYSGKVKLNYTVYDGWNTIALPFMVNDLSVFGTGAKVYALTGYNDGNLQLTSATSMALATPYVLYVETATTEPIVFDNVSIYSNTAAEADCNTTKNGATFQGTYSPIEAGSMNITWYGVTGEGKIMKAGSSASIKAMHAYFTLPEGDEAKTIAYDGIVAGDDGTATAINALINGNSQGELYDLSGRRVEGNVKAGIYVRNGKKIVIK